MNGHKCRDCQNKHRLQYSYCHTKGHVEKVSFKKISNTLTHRKTGANIISDLSFTAVTQAFFTSKPTACHKLMVGCGASSHIIYDESKFVSFDKTLNPKHHFIEVADRHQSNELVKARGTAKFTVLDSNSKSCEKTLSNAVLVPSFPTSQFSVRAAVKKGAKAIFSRQGNHLKVDDIQLDFSEVSNLHFLQTDSAAVYATKTLDEWHISLGHMNFDDIRQLAFVTNGMTIIKSDKPGTCVTCIQNKMPILPKSEDDLPSHATKPLQRVHSDIVGPITSMSKSLIHNQLF